MRHSKPGACQTSERVPGYSSPPSIRVSVTPGTCGFQVKPEPVTGCPHAGGCKPPGTRVSIIRGTPQEDKGRNTPVVAPGNYVDTILHQYVLQRRIFIFIRTNKHARWYGLLLCSCSCKQGGELLTYTPAGPGVVDKICPIVFCRLP